MNRSWVEATKAQYDDDTNLAARQAAFHYLVEAEPMPPPLSDFAVLSGLRVLDVGCGNGLFLSGAANGGAVAFGADLSAGMLTSAAEAAPGSPLLRADAVALPVADGSIDVTMALWMLYHVEAHPAAVAELRRVTKPDGYAVVSTNTGRRSFLDDLVEQALETTLGRAVDSWIPQLSFTGENGQAILSTAFDQIESHVGGNRFRFTDTEVVVRYVGSMTDAVAAANGPFRTEDLLAEVGRLTEAEIARSGAVELAQQRTVFICRG
ncbi:MAG: class I SAM-dependent methyltransferase [Acidimicrobiales bacterium]